MSTGNKIFDVAICTIFAREFLEGAIIIGQYRTILCKSPEWNKDEEKLKAGLKCITKSALLATFVAILVVIAVAVPLAVLSRDLDEKTADIIEGVSKIVASICILQLSLKIPKWLGVYASKKMGADGVVVGLSMKSIRFNVAWNIWREVAECGVFLIPFFLGEGAIAIPLSAVIGIIVGLAIGGLLYWGNRKLNNKKWLAFFMAAVLGMLSVGLFTGGCHEFEEVWGETPYVWKIDGGSSDSFWSHKRLPLALIKPFGYSSKRTQLQIAAFWSWFALLILLHFWKWWSSKKIFEAQALAEEELATGKAIGDGEEVPDDNLEETEKPNDDNIDSSNTSGSDIETGEQSPQNEEEQQQ
uniref:Iron permease FTR1 n=1 Tax=Minutocellus polymorphus TaxID=265543 RepID=A0A7S0AUA2_9STRA|eukprot:CAMPEP_0197725978 /NCGR_PEP_ID=MMETSP1434-20131217/12382_1 /TAXON_ID=265543 /ORGANISM="Minutocellus polymorphus, Strain CCMP3303" /LENGTH=355 /DNA_ID=CAMNT_0043311741 /DNA_START=69 /DNA_END=1136 /DNA_ORIENTATION=-